MTRYIPDAGGVGLHRSDSGDGLSFASKLQRVNWYIVFLLGVLGGVGVLMLYSAGGMSMDPWAGRHLLRLLVCFGVILVVAFVDIRVWYSFSYPIFATCIGALLFVEFVGYGSGAQRWINVFGFYIQPSEFAKVAMILFFARYFSGITYEQGLKLSYLLVPLLMLGIVVGLILIQPDLGTALMVFMLSGLIFWMVGVHRLWFFLAIVAAIFALPLAWNYLLYDYQKQRLLVFLNPDGDPLGEGYHILQSKIALGSGGFFGKGWGQGSQSSLEFLPEKHTDFIFTMIAEEFGFLGVICVLSVYILIICSCLLMVLRCRTEFCRVVLVGMALLFFIFVMINTAMVSGLLPVVGVPLPFVSYGGSVMLALSFGFGLVLNAGIYYDRSLPCAAGRRF